MTGTMPNHGYARSSTAFSRGSIRHSRPSLTPHTSSTASSCLVIVPRFACARDRLVRVPVPWDFVERWVCHSMTKRAGQQRLRCVGARCGQRSICGEAETVGETQGVTAGPGFPRCWERNPAPVSFRSLDDWLPGLPLHGVVADEAGYPRLVRHVGQRHIIRTIA